MPRTIPCLDLQFPDLSSDPGLPDRVALALDDLSAAAIHESGDEDRPVWRVFLDDPRAISTAARELVRRFSTSGLVITHASVEDADWAARSQSHLTRVSVGRLTIAPPWDAQPPRHGVLVVVLPSTGFGTGHHQTTRLCLRLLQETDVVGRRVLDLGTGSGVLALAAWRLGFAETEAVDCDPDAIANAAENIELNDASKAIALRQADLAADELRSADVVIANLTGALLCRQADTIRSLVRPGGVLILSGILEEEANTVRLAFDALTLIDDIAEDEWRAMRFRRE